MTQPLRVLVVEDRAADAELMVRELRRAGFTPEWRRVESEEGFVSGLDDGVDLVLADFRLPQFDGLAALRILRDRGPDVPFILVTGSLGEETAVDCIKEGADDFVLKDRLARLGSAVTGTLEQRRLRREHAQAVEERRRTTAQLVESERRYRALFENLLNGYFRGRIVRDDGTLDVVCLETNPAFERLTGLTAVVGKRLLEMFPEPRAEMTELIRIFIRAAEGAPPHPFVTLFSPLGIWVAATVYHAPPDEFIVVFDNITERRKAETALVESEARLHEAISGARIGLWDWDRDTGAVHLSPEWKQQIGYADDELESSYAVWESRLHPDDRDRTVTALKAYLADPSGSFHAEFRLLHRDGSFRWFRTRATMIPGGAGRPSRMFGFDFDVTDERRRADEYERLQAELRQAQKLEAIGQLTGGVAHDFNNLLTAILGFAAVLDDALDATDPRREDLHEIQAAGDRAATLTRQLLAFSRRQVFELKVVSVNALISDLVQMLRRLIGEHITLECRLEPDLGPTRVDPGQIEQVITNLVVNARDAMPNGGSLLIETATVAPDQATARAHSLADTTGRYVRLRVIDTGVGIEAEVLKHIFEPFFTTKPMGKGSGLGLSTVYGIVQQSDGFIEVDSRAGRGARFDVYLPIVAAEPDGRDAREPATVPRGSETILLVEDDGAIRRLGQRMLERRGYQILSANGPAEAMKVAAGFAEPIDLLVTDVRMPGGTGPELYQELERARPGLRVLFMSGYSDGAALEGINGNVFLQKPFDADRLTGKVREALERPSAA